MVKKIHHCPAKQKHSNTAACIRAKCLKKCPDFVECQSYVNDRNSVYCRSCTTRKIMEEKRRKEAEKKSEILFYKKK